MNTISNLNNKAPTEDKEKRTLKKIILMPKLQLKYVLFFTVPGFFLCLSLVCVFYFFMNENYFLLIKLSPMSNEVKAQLIKETQFLVWMLVVAIFSFISLLTIVGLYFSHRIVGPLDHLHMVIHKVKSGFVNSRLQIRSKDEFHDLANSFNEMLDYLNNNNK